MTAVPLPTAEQAPIATPLGAPARRLATALAAVNWRYRGPAGAGRGVDGAADDALFPCGKLLRPRLALLSCEAAGGSADAALLAGYAVESLHAATLVHDDIIDGDAVRRGRPTVQAAHGRDAALLAGDALVFRAFQAAADLSAVVSHARTCAVVRLLARTGSQLCSGEYDEQRTPLDSTGLRTYLEVAARKTGALMAASCAIGAVVGGACAADVQRAHHFGGLLGVAFQVRDDLLPYLSAPAAAGKDRSSDVRNGRVTLPLLVAWRTAGPRDRSDLQAALHGAGPVADRQQTVDRIVEEQETVARGLVILRQVGAAAVEQLPPAPSWGALAELAWTFAAPPV